MDCRKIVGCGDDYMIIDLAKCESDNSCDVDVAIIGAGIAGLTLADRLRRNGLRVAVVESGGRDHEIDVHPLNQVVQAGDPYHGWARRSRCLGGTSTQWGGALIPYVNHDLQARPYLDLPGFPGDSIEVGSYLPEVEKLFGVDGESYEEEVVTAVKAERYIPTGDGDFIARFAKWPVFKRRNLAALFKDTIKGDLDLKIWINATVTRFDFDSSNGRINTVEARHESGRRVTIAARQFVICAGGIESTRLLLLLDRQYDQRIFEGCGALGRYFYDHVSAPMAAIKTKNVRKLNRLAAFRFIGSTMRSLRFELSASAQERERVGSANGHISFMTDRRSGFDALRDLLRSQQRNGRLPTALIAEAIIDTPYLVNMAWWRFFQHQLLWPDGAICELQVVIEQLPQMRNEIRLAPKTDIFGSPLATIDWRVGAQEHASFENFRKCFDPYWKRQGLEAIGDLLWYSDAPSGGSKSAATIDVYHPGGSTRMGTDGKTSVVDSNLRVYGVRNLSVGSTSAFPTGGGANPTLTLMMFAMRLADHLAAGEARSSGAFPFASRSGNEDRAELTA